jgi:signal transduction histidine kinase
MRERVESLGGTVSLASDRGVTLTVELPLSETELESA